VDNKLEKLSKDAVQAYFKELSHFFLWKAEKYPNQDSNSGPSEYEAETLITLPRRSLLLLERLGKTIKKNFSRVDR
jgi:hypothetical protein